MNLANKRVLLTGGSGFLGQYVYKELIDRNVQSIFVPRSTDYDLVEQAAVRRLFHEHQFDILIHLAARVGGIGANKEHPGTYFYENLSMGINLLEESRKAGLEKAVVIGTICAYPKHTPIPFKETELWNGYPEETNAPYGIAKKALLVQSQAYREEYGFNSIYLLPVNLYGPGDNFDLRTSHVIPALIRKFMHATKNGHESVTLWGDGSASREFLYVEDAARAIVLATESYDSAEPVNIGSGQEITIKSLAERIKKMTDFDGEIVWDTTKPNGQPRRCLDVSRARSFGFEAKVSLEEGLKRTIDWWGSHKRDNQ
jgi:GDP-L-fucose synthase